MIEVSIGVGSGTARFSVAVRAESIQRAVRIVEAHHPAGDVWVAHPINPEAFFVKDPAAAAGLVELEKTEFCAVGLSSGPVT